MSKVLQNRVAILEGEPSDFVAIGATKTLNQNDHANRTFKLDTAAGSIAILPPATGSGYTYTFVVSVIATTNSHIIKVANASDAMQGFVFTRDDTADAAMAFFAAAGTSDTITLNRSTTGSVVVGETFRITDFALNRYQVEGFTASTGTPLTPFSNTVS